MVVIRNLLQENRNIRSELKVRRSSSRDRYAHVGAKTNSNRIQSSSPTANQNQSDGAPIAQLLKGFKLTQYSMKLSDMGYSDDIYKLAFLNNRDREELMSNLQLLPGHKERMLNLFKMIDRLNPHHQIQKTLNVAQN